jgi:hypothetical protein
MYRAYRLPAHPEDNDLVDLFDRERRSAFPFQEAECISYISAAASGFQLNSPSRKLFDRELIAWLNAKMLQQVFR